MAVGSVASQLCGFQFASLMWGSWAWQSGGMAVWGSPSRDVASLHRMVLCIATQDSHSLSHLSLRLGASLKSCRHLLENAKKSHVEVVGVRCARGASQPVQARPITFLLGIVHGHPRPLVGPAPGPAVLPLENVLS